MLGHLGREYHGPAAFVLHGLTGPAVWLAAAGVLAAWFLYLKRPALAAVLREKAGGLYTLLDNKYYFDWFNENVIAAATRLAGQGLWKGADQGLIDGLLVNGSARTVGAFAAVVRQIQTGHLYWYVLVMVLGVVGLMTWQLWPALNNLLSR